MDKALYESIVNDAVKGIGPAANAETIERDHLGTWQKKEIQWAAHLRRRIAKPMVHDLQMNDSDEVEKCPEYYSKDMGGQTPCASWLIHMFNVITEKLRPYYDSECLKRILSTMFMSLDASYKVPKWIMKWGGSKLFEVLESGLNEYGEIILQHFELSDNHRQLGTVLLVLKEHGLNPSFVFTDVPGRDRGFLQDLFPSLREGVSSTSFQERSDMPSDMPLLPLRGEIMYIHTQAAAEAALTLLGERLDGEADVEKRVISIDFEWPVYDGGRRSGRVSVISMASDVQDEPIVLHIARMRSTRLFFDNLKNLLRREDVAFTGRCIASDFTKLRGDYPDHEIQVAHVVDCGTMAVHRGVTKRILGHTTLQALSGTSLGLYVPKPAHIRVGEVFDDQVNARELDQEARVYCARDSEAGLRLYHHYRTMPDLTIRAHASYLQPGMRVDIMPQATTATEPIAEGTVVQLGGVTRHGINLSKNRFLIKVTKVLDPKALVHFPWMETGVRCKCLRLEHGKLREICNFRSFEDFPTVPPFTIVETVGRLRLRHEVPLEESTGELPGARRGDDESMGIVEDVE
jgi:hypothetical protein